MSMRGGVHDEKGASAIFIAFTMLLLMAVAAVVVDGGLGWSERRQAQSAVDFASLAALHASVGANPKDAGAAEAMAVVAANLPGRVLQSWASCTDPGRPAAYTIVSSLSPCISFTKNFGQARVKLPIDTLDNSFGPVIGFATTEVSAAAEATQQTRATADIIPLTVGTGSSVCIYSNQAPQTVPPCNGPLSGFFGYLDIALHGSPPELLDNPSTCEQGTTQIRIAINLAKGADHIMVEHNAGDPVIDDWAVCPNLSEDINQVHVQTGTISGAITDGLINGISGSINGQPFGPAPGRLIPTAASTASASIRGTTLDNTPLWTHLLDPDCSWAGSPLISGAVDSHDEMVACLDAWSIVSPGPIFDADVDLQQRFAAVPVFNPYPSGPGAYLIDRFAPIWIETLYQNCNSFRCRTVFTPFDPSDTSGTAACPNPLVATTINCGHSHTSGSNDVEGATALQLQIGMLDPADQETFPGSATLREVSLLK